MTFLLTDPTVIGAVSWASVVIGIVGFAVTLWQLRQVKTTSRAAAEAAKAARSVVREHDILTKLAQALQNFKLALSALARPNVEMAMLFFDNVCAQLVDAGQIIDDKADRAVISRCLINIRSILEGNMTEAFSGGDERPINLPSKRLQTTLSDLEELSAKLRYRHLKEAQRG